MSYVSIDISKLPQAQSKTASSWGPLYFGARRDDDEFIARESRGRCRFIASFLDGGGSPHRSLGRGSDICGRIECA